MSEQRQDDITSSLGDEGASEVSQKSTSNDGSSGESSLGED